jgi:hypothetical protein
MTAERHRQTGPERNGNLSFDDEFTRLSQRLLHEVGLRFDEADARLESIDAQLKLQTGLIYSCARAMALSSSAEEDSEEGWSALAVAIEALERKLDGTAQS